MGSMANILQKSSHVVVVMVPLPAQGHLNQLLHLSRLISAYDIPVHFVGTTTHNRQAKTRVQGWDPLAIANIKFHEFPTPHFSNPLPDPNSLVKFPSQLFPSIHASTKLREPVHTLVRKLSCTARRVVVIYDSLMAYVVQDTCSIPNVESYCFQSISAFSSFSFYWEAAGKPILPTEAENIGKVPSVEGCFSPEFLELSNLQSEVKIINSGEIYNTARVIEGIYLDLIAKDQSTRTEKLWALGPFNPLPISGKEHANNSRNKCLEWLDKQETNSVIFVSFGTTSSLSDEQVTELAYGLERSKQKFIWVLRDADKGDIFKGEVRKAPLPEGYEERINGTGLIVRDWAPQLDILGHPSTGGFISHCGWNSCMESISMGVPMGVWPMHSDQPRNAVLITKALRIGVEVKDWGRRDEVVKSIIVEKAVRRLMASVEGDEMKRRAKKLGDAVKKSVMEGGDTHKEMDSFIANITR